MKNGRLITAGLALSGTIWLCAAPPTWWTDRVGVTGTSKPKAVATIGQLKNMAHHAHDELETEIPGGAGFALTELFPPAPNPPTQAWKDEQHKVANLGQLKYIAQPFYDRLNALAPNWVDAQMETNDPVNLATSSWTHDYPWDPSTPKDENLKIATHGQVKLVFSLRTREDSDSDSIADLTEHILYGSTTGDGSTTDFDGDGLMDRDELLTHGTSPTSIDTDGDGLTDQEEVLDTSLDPLVAEAHDPTSVTTLIVLTPLQN